MTKISKIIASSFLGLALISSSASACYTGEVAAKKGQKAYQKKLSIKCGMNSEEFASYHTQDEWNQIKLSGNFVSEVEDICEKPVSLTEKETQNIFKYVHKWAADSGLVTTEEG